MKEHMSYTKKIGLLPCHRGDLMKIWKLGNLPTLMAACGDATTALTHLSFTVPHPSSPRGLGPPPHPVTPCSTCLFWRLPFQKSAQLNWCTAFLQSYLTTFWKWAPFSQSLRRMQVCGNSSPFQNSARLQGRPSVTLAGHFCEKAIFRRTSLWKSTHLTWML